MNWLRSLKIRTKLVLLLLAPLAGLLYMGVGEIKDKQIYGNQISQIQALSHFTSSASALVHELQKERGASAGFLGSKGKKFVTELPAQRGQTDTKLLAYQTLRQDLDLSSYPEEMQSQVATAENLLTKIRDIRGRVSAQKILTTEAIGFYTKINTAFLESIAEVAKLSPDPVLTRQLIAFSAFIKAKERAGIERAVMSNVFSQGSFTGGMFQRFSSLVAEQGSFLNIFKAYASDEQKSFYNDAMSAPAVAQVDSWRSYAFGREKQSKTFSGLPANLGYGGLIHHFKNFIIRGNRASQTQALASIENIEGKIQSLRKGKLSKVDLTDLERVEGLMKQYRKNLDRIQASWKARSKVRSIDKSISIKDGPALAALNRLTLRKLEVDPILWFKTITKKINLLKSVENKLNQDFLDYAAQMQSGVVSVYMIIGVVVILTLIISLIIGMMIQNMLKALIDDLNKSADQQVAASKQVADTSILLSQGATEQAAALEETSASIEEINGQTKGNTSLARDASDLMGVFTEEVKHVAQKAESAAEISHHAQVSANNGVQAMDAINGAMEKITQSSQEIDDIIEILKDITHQTKMLATNAAIEAARAGEQGKGFAVVADEVSRLAEHSKASAKEVASLTQKSQQQVQEGKKLSDQGLKVLSEIAEQSEQTAGLMSEIVSSITNQADKAGEAAQSVDGILNASMEQSVAIDEVSRAIVEIDSVTQSNAAAAEENSAAAEELTAQAQILQELVDLISAQVESEKERRKSRESRAMEHAHHGHRDTSPPAIAKQKAEPVAYLPEGKGDFNEF